MVCVFCSLIVNIGIVDNMGAFISVIRNPLEENEKSALLNCLEFLVTFCRYLNKE